MLGKLSSSRSYVSGGRALHAAVVVDGDPPGHRHQPGPQRLLPLRAQPVRVAPGPQQRLLDDVLGPLAVAAGEPEHEHQQRSRVLLVEHADQGVFVIRGGRPGPVAGALSWNHCIILVRTTASVEGLPPATGSLLRHAGHPVRCEPLHSASACIDTSRRCLPRHPVYGRGYRRGSKRTGKFPRSRRAGASRVLRVRADPSIIHRWTRVGQANDTQPAGSPARCSAPWWERGHRVRQLPGSGPGAAAGRRRAGRAAAAPARRSAPGSAGRAGPCTREEANRGSVAADRSASSIACLAAGRASTPPGRCPPRARRWRRQPQIPGPAAPDRAEPEHRGALAGPQRGHHGGERGRQVLLLLGLDVAERARQLPPAAQRTVHHQQVAPSSRASAEISISSAVSGPCTAAGSLLGLAGAADPVHLVAHRAGQHVAAPTGWP